MGRVDNVDTNEVTFKLYPPISAKINTPGPGKYSTPSMFGGLKHDFTRYKNPSFTFGGKGPSCLVESKARSPGPAYAIKPEITCKGPQKAPACTLSPMLEPLPAFKTPAANRYDLAKCQKATNESAPAFTMRPHVKLPEKFKTPAPKYDPINVFGRSSISTVETLPSYTLRKKPTKGGIFQDNKTPGPNAYSVTLPSVTKAAAPAYSFAAKTEPISQLDTPAPGAHDVHKVTVNSPYNPSYSIGRHHSPYKLPVPA